LAGLVAGFASLGLVAQLGVGEEETSFVVFAGAVFLACGFYEVLLGMMGFIKLRLLNTSFLVHTVRRTVLVTANQEIILESDSSHCRFTILCYSRIRWKLILFQNNMLAVFCSGAGVINRGVHTNKGSDAWLGALVGCLVKVLGTSRPVAP
jgi:hypothetical protein